MSDNKPSQAEGDQSEGQQDNLGGEEHEVLSTDDKPSQAEGN